MQCLLNIKWKCMISCESVWLCLVSTQGLNPGYTGYTTQGPKPFIVIWGLWSLFWKQMNCCWTAAVVFTQSFSVLFYFLFHFRESSNVGRVEINKVCTLTCPQLTHSAWWQLPRVAVNYCNTLYYTWSMET